MLLIQMGVQDWNKIIFCSFYLSFVTLYCVENQKVYCDVLHNNRKNACFTTTTNEVF
jgi:hypothetical protein